MTSVDLVLLQRLQDVSVCSVLYQVITISGTLPRFAISVNCPGDKSFASMARIFVTIPLYSSKFPIGYTSVILRRISWAYSVCFSSYSF